MFIVNLPDLIKVGLVNKDDYIIVDCDMSTNLQINGFPLISERDNLYYFAKTDEILNYILNCKTTERGG